MAPHAFEVGKQLSQLVGKAKEALSTGDSASATGSDIIDIRRDKVEISLEESILNGMLYKPNGQKSLPTMLLYSAEGLKLFEEITYLDEYYLTNTEIGVLEKYAENMAERVQDGTVLVELGSGFVPP